MAPSHSFMYVDADVPPEMTLDDWRRRNAPVPRRHGRFVRSLRRIAH